MSKFIIIDKNTGYSLRNLPSASWNDGSHAKGMRFWTFAGPDRPASHKAVALLAEKGFANIEFVPFDEQVENKMEFGTDAPKSAADKAYAAASAPLSEEEVSELDEWDESLFNELNHVCLRCAERCKQSSKAVLYRCPQYRPIKKD